jgi:hypothetical protein
MFTVDTTNSKITLGAPSATPVLLVLGNKNTSGDPTCTDGAIYYNSSFKQFRACANGTWLSFGNNDGWQFDGDQTWTYASASSFTVSGDQTAAFTSGTRIKLTQSSTVEYFVVTSSSYSSPNTTVNITGGSDYTLANSAISANFHSYAANPQGYPTWFNFAPATTGITGGSEAGRFNIIVKQVTIMYYASSTSSSTGKTFTLPVAASSGASTFNIVSMGKCRDNNVVKTTACAMSIGIDGSNTHAVLSVDATAGSSTWTASGSWYYIGSISYSL